MGMTNSETLQEPLLSGGLLNQVDVLSNDASAVLARVPLNLIYDEKVPVDDRLLAAITSSMACYGQKVPIPLVEIQDNHGASEGRLAIVDGFYRYEGRRWMASELQSTLAETMILATIQGSMEQEEMLDARILASHSHPTVGFARRVRWIQQAWQATEWARKITVSGAFGLAAGIEAGQELPESLETEEVSAVSGWIQRKCEAWHMNAVQIRDHLAIASTIDPALVQDARYARRHRLSPGHVAILSICLPGEFDLQKMAAQTMVEQQLDRDMSYGLAFALRDISNQREAAALIKSETWRHPQYSPLTRYTDNPLLTNLLRRMANPAETSRRERHQLDAHFEAELEACHSLIAKAMISGAYRPLLTNMEGGESGEDDEAEQLEQDGVSAMPADESSMVDSGEQPTVWSQEDAEDFIRLADSLTPVLIRRAQKTFGIPGEEAKHVAQETLLSLYRALQANRLHEGDSRTQQAYIRRTFENKAIDWYRWLNASYTVSIHKYGVTALDTPLGGRGMTYTDLPEFAIFERGYDGVSNEYLDYVKETLPGLPEKQRRMFLLTVFFNLGIKETAAVMDVPEGTVKSGTWTVRRKLYEGAPPDIQSLYQQYL